jgi:hypothetical protein
MPNRVITLVRPDNYVAYAARNGGDHAHFDVIQELVARQTQPALWAQP